MPLTIPGMATASTDVRRRLVQTAPPEAYFVVSAIFHYLGPAFAVLLFARVDVLGVAWLRIASAAAIFALWRRPWRSVRAAATWRLLLAWGAVLAVMNSTFYLAIDRLPLGTVAAIEFLPVIVLAAVGARTRRNLGALALAVPGVYLLTDVALTGDPLGVAFAFVNAALFAAYIVVSHRAAQNGSVPGIDLLGMAMLIAAVVATPIGAWAAVPAFTDPVAIAAGIGVGDLVLGHPLRHRPARDGAHVALDLRAHGRAAAGDGDGHRHRRPRAAAQRGRGGSASRS